MTKTFEHYYQFSHVRTQVEPTESAGAARKSCSNSAELNDVIVTTASTGSWNK